MSLYKIDDVTLPDHHFLTGEDFCYFLLNYKPNAGFNGGATNSLILNFKKSLDRRGFPDYRYKEQAIRKVGQLLLAHVIPSIDLGNTTLVPIPPSKSKNNVLFDNRMTQALQVGCHGLEHDVRELLVTRQDSQPVHISDNHRDPDALFANIGIDLALTPGLKKNVVLFDDVITTGAHYLASRRRLLEYDPDLNVSGIFIARREPLSPANDFLDELRKIFG